LFLSRFKQHSKKIAIVFIFLIVVFTMVVFFQPRFILAWFPNAQSNVTYFVETNDKSVALTIDDGPDSEYTPKILDLLAKYEVVHCRAIVLWNHDS